MINFDPQKLNQRLQEIKDLEKKKAEIEARLALITGLIQETDPLPKGFDYRETILKIFEDGSDMDLNIDDVTKQITIKYNFRVDRKAVANRINYLTDRDKKLQRIKGKRGFYRLFEKEREQEEINEYQIKQAM